MTQETEIKLRVEDLRAFRRALKRLGAALVSRRAHEWNELFDTPGHDLRRRGQLLRIRTESAARGRGTQGGPLHSEKSVLTFKGPLQGRQRVPRRRLDKHKVLEETEAQLTQGRALAEILTRLGMRVWFRYEKYRTTFRLPARQRWAEGLLIELDETPMGAFVELEGPPRAIDRAAKALGYSRRDYLTANYFVLYRDARRRKGQRPGDMLFRPTRPAKSGR